MEWRSLKEEDEIEHMLVFAQPERRTKQNVCYMADRVFAPDLEDGDRVFVPDLDGSRIGTLNAKQKKVINEGIDTVTAEDNALRKCVRAGGGSSLKKMMCMLPVALSVNGVESYTTNNITNHHPSGYDRSHDVIVASADPYYGPDETVLKTVNDAAAKGVSAIYFAEQFPGPERHGPCCEEMKDMKWYDARGNLSFMTNNDTLAESVMKWSNGEHMYEPPKCIDDLQDADEAKGLVDVISDAHENSLANTAFAGKWKRKSKTRRSPDPSMKSSTMKTSETIPLNYSCKNAK